MQGLVHHLVHVVGPLSLSACEHVAIASCRGLPEYRPSSRGTDLISVS
jgi:hypothetical protein